MCAALLPLSVVLELCPHAGHQGQLTIDYGVGRVRTKVRPHLGKLFLFLARAWHADKGASVPFRGLRSAEYIAHHWKRWPASCSLSATTVRSYVKRIRKLVSEAVQALAQSIGRALEVPELIVGENGYRLGRDRAEIVGADLDW